MNEITRTSSLGQDTETASEVIRRLRSIFGGSIGNLIEWYDFYIYNSFALYFTKFFFPDTDPTVAYIQIFTIYAVGFFIRPVGGWILGIYADYAGRRAALTLAVVMMCFGTELIGIIPSYVQIGIWAPILLLVGRLIQGFSLGGEYGTSATYLSEVATAQRRGFYSSFQYVTLIGGQLLAALVLLILQQVLTANDLEAWGWRLPFMFGALCALYGFYLRRNLAETDDFLNARAARDALVLTATTQLDRIEQKIDVLIRKLHKPPSGLRQLAAFPREVLLVFGLTMGGTVAFYTYTVYMPTFLVNTVKLSREQATVISFVTLFVYMCLQPAFGALSDAIGRRPVLLWFGIMGTLCTVPILTALSHTHDFWMAMALAMGALIIVSGYTSINAVVKAELFPASVRALGVGFPYAVAASLFGGTAPAIALWFKREGVETYFYWYVTALIFGSMIVYALMRDTKDYSRIQS